MLGWLKLLPVLPQVVGLVKGLVELIRMIEELKHGAGQGAAKKQLVLDLLKSSVSLAQRLGIKEASGIDPGAIAASADTFIDTAVAALNAAGVFKHAPAPRPQ